MSRGGGKVRQFILGTLRAHSDPMSGAELRYEYELDIELELNLDELSPQQKHSVRMSMDRALRQLKAAAQTDRDADGNWSPTKDWHARDEARREPARLAHHEAGHAVIGLALKQPVGFATIKARNGGGFVSDAPFHRAVGAVYARGSYRRPVADLSDIDAFGNPVEQYAGDRHADIITSIAGGMAEAEYLKDGSTWRKHASSGDMQNIGFSFKQLGDAARPFDEYVAECSALVKQHWSKIEAVAARLLKEDTLSGGDIYAICWRDARNVVRRQHLQRKP
jgi:hypothetical protein